MNLSICTTCGKNPAIYGDGLTWSRCSLCQYEAMKNLGDEPAQLNPVGLEEKREHKIIPGLTSIIIPVYMCSYTLFHYTGNCIGSVREHTSKGDYEIVIIDNGSPIKPPSSKSYYADKVITNEKNMGVTHAWNQGIRMSQGEFIVLLNNDVQVFNRWLPNLRDTLGSFDLVMAHPMYSLTEPFARSEESRKILIKEKKEYYSNFKDFSCVMFKRSLVDELGGFDERFFSYCSDSDFFKRMEEVGKKFTCVESVATSHISDATGFSIPETADLMNKDKEEYRKKWEEIKSVDEQIEGNTSSFIYRTPQTGDSIYFVKNNLYHKIKDPDTLHALGFNFGDEKSISIIELNKMAKTGEEISMLNYQKYV